MFYQKAICASIAERIQGSHSGLPRPRSEENLGHHALILMTEQMAVKK
jgi:hypothetical protein